MRNRKTIEERVQAAWGREDMFGTCAQTVLARTLPPALRKAWRAGDKAAVTVDDCKRNDLKFARLADKRLADKERAHG